MKQINLQALYILHARAYRDTSLLLECLTEHHGKISLVARGVKKNKSLLRPILQPFIPLLVSWQGRGELSTLTAAEVAVGYKTISGDKLFNAFYINELLNKLLHRHDPCAEIFYAYKELLNTELNEINLRFFEKILLTELGYGLNLLQDSRTHQALQKDKQYYFHAETGCVDTEESTANTELMFSGESLLAIAENNFYSAEILRDAKRLMRLAFQPLLGGRALKSRELFISQKS